MKVWPAFMILAMTATPIRAASFQAQVSAKFESAGPDRKAIKALLDTYTRAVSTKDQGSFETLLLNKSIPFSGVPLLPDSSNTVNYEAFRKAVFEGRPFTQQFRDIHILQDGALAQVSLVFVNSEAGRSTWGWKTMQLLKVHGSWKIAAEFFTGHA